MNTSETTDPAGDVISASPHLYSPRSVVFDLPDDVYRAAPGVSQSMLKHLDRSPMHMRYALEHREATRAMLIGQVFHHAMLTPKLPPWWKTAPEGIDFRTKAGKSWKEEHSDMPWITWDESQQIVRMVNACLQNKTVVEALRDTACEVSAWAEFTYGYTVLRKGRLDVVTKGAALVDFKTTDDASFEGFAKAVYNLKYYRQAAYYLDLWNDALIGNEALLSAWGEKTEFVFVGVEKEPPHGVAVYRLCTEDIRRGRGEYIDRLGIYADCVANNRWPGYPEHVQTINMPRWSAKA